MKTRESGIPEKAIWEGLAGENFAAAPPRRHPRPIFLRRFSLAREG
jgi:hypothetical protein